MEGKGMGRVSQGCAVVGGSRLRPPSGSGWRLLPSPAAPRESTQRCTAGGCAPPSGGGGGAEALPPLLGGSLRGPLGRAGRGA